jgi:hypothetical protein
MADFFIFKEIPGIIEILGSITIFLGIGFNLLSK